MPVLDFLYVAVSWVLLRWHQLFDAIGFDPNGGLAWALSIVFLVITARLLLFRLFVKQVHYQRNMQRLQPQIKKLREKHKDDRAELNRQMMKFQQEEGFNPVGGCLPMFLQIPVFLGLYHVLRHVSNSGPLCRDRPGNKLLELYTFSGGAGGETCSAAKANLFGAPLASSFHDSTAKIENILGGNATTARIVIVVLLVISAVATLVTQLMVRANATVAPEGTAATIQNLMLWIIPVGVLASGLLFNFPLGVLLYWFTSNLWTLAQQAYIIRFHPPEEETAKPVGEIGKTLAPRPGQRPVRMAKSGAGAGAVDEAELETADAVSASAARANTPRPGQRPNRGNGKRPPAKKKATQAKKRR